MAAQQQKQNYQRILEHTLEEIGKKRSRSDSFYSTAAALPAAASVLEYLSQYFEITVFITIPIFTRKQNTGNGPGSRNG